MRRQSRHEPDIKTLPRWVQHLGWAILGCLAALLVGTVFYQAGVLVVNAVWDLF